VLKHLRPGDIYTHAYLAWVPMLDGQGRVEPYMFEAGSAASSSTWATGRQLRLPPGSAGDEAGLRADSISTDLHWTSMNGGMMNMLTSCRSS